MAFKIIFRLRGDDAFFPVNIHVKNILSKLGVSGRTEAVTLALRKGILHID